MTNLATEALQTAEKRFLGLTMPWRIGLAVLGLLVALGVVYTITHSSIDWFNHAKKRADHAEAVATNAASNADARGLEAQGAQATTQRVEITVKQARAAQDATVALAQSARTAPDANDLIPADRVARLRSNDDELCRIDPALVGCAAPSGNAGDGR